MFEVWALTFLGWAKTSNDLYMNNTQYWQIRNFCVHVRAITSFNGESFDVLSLGRPSRLSSNSSQVISISPSQPLLL